MKNSFNPSQQQNHDPCHNAKPHLVIKPNGAQSSKQVSPAKNYEMYWQSFILMDSVIFFCRFANPSELMICYNSYKTCSQSKKLCIQTHIHWLLCSPNLNVYRNSFQKPHQGFQAAQTVQSHYFENGIESSKTLQQISLQILKNSVFNIWYRRWSQSPKFQICQLQSKL